MSGIISGSQIDNSGVVGAYPAGHVLQVLSTTKTDVTYQSASSATWYDISGISVVITPRATSSKVLVTVVANIGMQDDTAVGLQILRDSTAIGIGDASQNRTRTGTEKRSAGSDIDYGTENLVMQFLDSPSTTSSTTYKVQWRSMYTTSTIYLNASFQDNNYADRSRNSSTITLMEVAG